MTPARAEAVGGNGVMRNAALGLLALLVLTIPLENTVVLSIGSMTKAIGYATFALGFVALVDRGRLSFRAPSVFLISAGLFVLWSVLGYFWSLTPSLTLSRAFTFAQLFALVWVIWEYARTDVQRAVLMQAYLLGAYITLFIGFSNFFSTDAGYRFIGQGLNANDYAIVLALGIPMAWRLTFLLRQRWLYWINVLYLPLSVAGIVIAASRGGFIAATLALGIIPLTFGRLSLARKIGLFALIAAAVWGIFFYAPQVFPELKDYTARIFETSQELQSGSLTGRRNIWAAGWTVFAEHPYVGIGGGGYRLAIAPIYGKAITAHNAYLSVLVEQGIVGFVLFMLMWLSLIVPLLLGPWDSTRRFAFVILLTLAVGIFSLSGEAYKYTWFVLSIAASEMPWITTVGERSRKGQAAKKPRLGHA